MVNLTTIYDAASSFLYELNIVERGIASTPASAIALRAGCFALGHLTTACVATKAITAESRSIKIGGGLLALGTFALTIYGALVIENEFLQAGCFEIFKEFGNCIPSYSPCNQFICTVKIKLPQLL